MSLSPLPVPASELTSDPIEFELSPEAQHSLATLARDLQLVAGHSIAVARAPYVALAAVRAILAVTK